MFTLRRFVAPRCNAALATSTSFATAAPLLSTCIATAYTGNNNNNNRGNNNNNRNFNNNNNRGNNNNNNNNNNNRNYNNNDTNSSRSNNYPAATPARVSGFTRNGEAFCDISSPADTQAQGYRLIVAFPTSNCNFMDIQYVPQVRDKSPTHSLPAAGETPENMKEEAKQATGQSNFIKTRIFGMPILSLTVRLYPLQMAKVVSVLEGKSSEAVIASRLAVGTFKRNSDGTISYAIQTRVPKPEENQPTSVEITISAVEAFMLEKFFGKMMVMGFDSTRDQASAVAGRK